MCGIFLYCGKPTDPQALRECFLRSQHRGPDNTQFLVYYLRDKMLAFGFHRLSINGLNAKAHQPMFYGHTISLCNGEIWNSDEMHRACDTPNDSGSESGSDCECLPLYYRDILENSTNKYAHPFETLCNTVDGVFGLVLFDRLNSTIYVGRDKIGIRSLYYAVQDDDVYVASELKSIPTQFSNIQAFPPGHWATIDVGESTTENDAFSICPYWSLRASRRLAYLQPECSQEMLSYDLDYLNCCGKLENVLVEAVKKRFMSDRPIGCVLSGGLDSTVVTAIACKLHTQQHPKQPPLRTYTIGMEGAEDFKWARMAAKHLGTDHHEFVLTEEDFLEAIPDVIAQIESYDVTTVRASTGNWLLAKKIAELGKDTVLFCGDVADELLGGYRGFGMTTDADAFDDENVKMLENIHRFDVLRCEKSFAGHGLEGRVPFADHDVVDLLMSVPPEFKMWDGVARIEKDLLRRAFQSYLPDALVWRRKEAFSDGVSQKEKSWFQIIQDKLINEPVARRSHASPYDAESTYYREIYESMYSSVKNIPYLWKQPFSNVADPSARCLANYGEDED